MVDKLKLINKEKAVKQNRVWVRISNACNNNCIFCLDSHSHNGTFIDEEKVKKQIKEGFQSAYENRVIISGGEASINPKFSEYIKYAKKVWYDRIQTITNWVMFWNQDFAKKVINAWLQEITFSFHGHTEKLHDYLVGTPWSFKKSLSWLLFIKKNHPKIIVNIDIVVNKINIKFLPDIVNFFMKFWVYEFDILQIIPFGRAFFPKNKKKLFYSIEENIVYLQKTWKFSRIPWMYMWTNRFPSEAFEWFEDLIQDPNKIKWEVEWEVSNTFDLLLQSKWKDIPQCFWERCKYCFLKQYCHDFIKISNLNNNFQEIPYWKNDIAIISGEEFPSMIYKKYWETGSEFKKYLKNLDKKIINIPRCLWWTWIFQNYLHMNPNYTLEDYTKKYIKNLYRKKALSCKACKYFKTCEWIHINFIRAYWFSILKPIIWK